MSIADGGLRHLCNEGLRVEEQQMLQRATLIEFLLDQVCSDAIRMPATLHDCLIWRREPAKEQRDPEQAFKSCYGDFRRRTIRHDVDERDNTRGREIEVRQLGARCVHDEAERHRYELEMRKQSLVD